ncbi:MAG: hypothetical protein IPN76_21495 [Saprospiraceae bacterium]|nr:hypothetical protein [Saprospiraceae bacterium]
MKKISLKTFSAMKKSTIKCFGLCLIALNIAVFFCEMQNVKIIIDETALLGVELDFSETKLSLKHREPARQIGQEIAMP